MIKKREAFVAYLVEEVLNELSDSDVIVVAVNEQHLLQVFELRDGVVAVPRRLSAFFTHDALRGKDVCYM